MYGFSFLFTVLLFNAVIIKPPKQLFPSGNLGALHPRLCFYPADPTCLHISRRQEASSGYLLHVLERSDESFICIAKATETEKAFTDSVCYCHSSLLSAFCTRGSRSGAPAAEGRLVQQRAPPVHLRPDQQPLQPG